MNTRILSLIVIICTSLFSYGQNSILGKVKSTTGEALSGAKVRLQDTYLGAYTDEDGAFKISNLRNGDYIIHVSHPGHEPMTQAVSIDSRTIVVDFELNELAQLIQEVMVKHVKADEKTPTTYTNLSNSEVDKTNYGQDLPFLLRMTPSTVVSSDAGAGVGYTGIRIRGVDPTRTNVTINGVPLNDSESHGVFWVNMPDFASSIQNIQVQRGVGTSSNGSTAFGASINIKTDDIHKEAYGELDNGYGSFNTWRHTLKAGTGLINDKFTMDMRLSKISSDGYVDRASSDLKSFYVSGAWLGKNTSLRTNIFSGKEKTYQAWYGVPESKLNHGQVPDSLSSHYYNNAYPGGMYQNQNDSMNLYESDNRTFNYYTYENEVDNYQQSHYQLHFAHRFGKYVNLNVTGHYTRGQGYYEQFRYQDALSSYGLDPIIFTNDTVTNSDIIRRRWLDNHFYGGIFSLNYNKSKLDLTLGGGINNYQGRHFGEIIWAEFASNSDIRDTYYDNEAEKLEAHTYLKATYKWKKVTLYGDIQYRHIDYSFLGVDEVSGSLVELDQKASYDFINPKAGFMIDFNNKNNVYASIAMANREPVRADFRENTPNNRPNHEQLLNVEAGYRYKGQKLYTNANIYYMNYKDQLVLTGQINDVGGYTRVNVDDSYRMGIEIEAGYQLFKKLSVSGNLTLSQNKIKNFNEFVDNYDVGGQDTIPHTNTDLAFSPNVIASFGIDYEPLKGLRIGLISKYVGQQFLDNTSTTSRNLDAYFVSNLQLSYTLKDVLFEEITFGVVVNNLFNELYENNGYTWGYVAGGQRTVENFYYPQAGRNLMTRLTIKL